VTGRTALAALWPAFGLLFGCASISVSYDYDAQKDFSPLKTYGWKSDSSLEQANQLIAKRVKRAVQRELGAKGFKETEQNPDFLIALHEGKESGFSVRERGYRYAPEDRYRGRTRSGYWGPGWIEVQKYEEGILVLDIIDARTEELIWRGSAAGAMERTLTPRESEKRVGQAVAKMLSSFPPPKE
jgi:hypothetical protein